MVTSDLFVFANVKQLRT